MSTCGTLSNGPLVESGYPRPTPIRPKQKNSCVPVSSPEKKRVGLQGFLFILNFLLIKKYQILHQKFILIVNYSKIASKRLKKL